LSDFLKEIVYIAAGIQLNKPGISNFY